jgi:hypothetical protein
MKDLEGCGVLIGGWLHRNELPVPQYHTGRQTQAGFLGEGFCYKQTQKEREKKSHDVQEVVFEYKSDLPSVKTMVVEHDRTLNIQAVLGIWARVVTTHSALAQDMAALTDA